MTIHRRRIGHRLALAILAASAIFAQFTAFSTPAYADTQICGLNGAQGGAAAVADNLEVAPDNWNSTGGLCISTTGGTDFTVGSSTITWNNHRVGGPGAYPHIRTKIDDPRLPAALSSLGDTYSTWYTTAGSGAYNTAYDIWYNTASACTSTTPYVAANNTSLEIMIWLNHPGLDGILASLPKVASDFTIGGIAYDLYQLTGGHGGTELIYDMRTDTTSVDQLNLRLFSQDAINRGLLNPGYSLCSVRGGFEIHDGGNGLRTDSFSVVFDGEPPAPVNVLHTGTITSRNGGRCVDNQGGGTGNGNRIQLWDCNGTDAQKVAVASDDTLRIQGKCLTPAGFATANDTSIQLWDCVGHPAQKWQAQADGTIVNTASGRCFDAAANAGGNGTEIQLWDCTGGPGQYWNFPGIRPWPAAMVNQAHGACLDVLLGLSYNGARVQLWSCDGNNAQRPVLPGDGTIRLLGRCVTPTGGSTAHGTNLQLWDCNGSPGQQWSPRSDGTVVNPASGRCFDGQDGGVPAQIQLRDCTGSHAQKWLIPVDSAQPVEQV